MKFKSFFDFKCSEKELTPYQELLKGYQFKDHFLRHIDSFDTDYYDGIFSAIVSVITENKVNIESQTQGKGDGFRYEPLKGLFKVHCLEPGIESLCKNMGDAFNKRIKVCDDRVEIDKILIKKIENSGLTPDKFLKRLVQTGIDARNGRKQKNRLTGNWLIFGKEGEHPIFLYYHLSTSHSKTEDELIYNKLIEIYSEEYISILKSGK